ncbi:hypothetical protein [Streptomyces sp. NPDC058330]|uniref:hypothetical protein n=1 Tax=Streptomyces sp. NPDC058330 TaxID=3346449 RepID=UPI0036E3F418
MTLRIVVTARHLPDDASSDDPLSELDEYAVEQALRTTVAHERVSVRRSGPGPPRSPW